VKFIDWHNMYTSPHSVPAGIQRLLVGIFFSILYSLLNQFYPISFLATQAFVVSHYTYGDVLTVKLHSEG